MNPATRILVADDEPNLRRVLATMLRRDGYDVVLAPDGQSAIDLLDDTIDVVLSDLRMPESTGMDVLTQTLKMFPQVPVILMTAYGSVGQAVEAMKAGAFDYIEKPFEHEQVRDIIRKAALQSHHERQEPKMTFPVGAVSGTATSPVSGKSATAATGNAAVTGSSPAPNITDGPGKFGLIGQSPEISAIFDIIERVANTPSTVLITGESGTGKELVARAFHENSRRKHGPFIKINCAAIPKNLMESELFGYEKGAFTGATQAKPGRFELAHEGTLFLDEIGEIPVEMQVKLLRAIQESEFERVGGIRTLKVDVRLVTATNRELEQEIARGNFREDLFYRLNVVPVHISPLRKRVSDIPFLVKHIIARFNERLGKNCEGVTPRAMQLLQAYSWPGNIRELENVLERTILFTSSPLLDAGDLPVELAEVATFGDSGRDHTIAKDVSGEPGKENSLKDVVRAEASKIEREMIANALEETGGNVTQTAKLLRISRKSLQMKMKELGLRDLPE